MKKMLIFSLAYFPTHVGGAEVAVKEITDRVEDIEFHLITQRFDVAQPAHEKIGNVQVHRVGSGTSYIAKILFVPRAALMTLRLHRHHHFDAAWAMMCYMTFPLMLLRLCGVPLPYVLSLQEGDPFEHVFRRPHIVPFLPLLRAGFRKAIVVQAISQYLAGWARTVGACGAIEVIPNGVDVARFTAEHPQGAINEIKDKLGKGLGDVFLITTSRLVHKNAIEDVIRALPQLSENVKFIVLGTGADEAKLKALAEKNDVEDRVQFLGHVGHRDLPKYLRASDIFIRPSRSEGMGNSFIEAMAAGLPVIATQEGGIADFLFDEKRNPDKPVTGFAVDKNSPDQIASAVKQIMTHPEKVRAVIATARQMAIDTYDWDMVARDMCEKVFAAALGE